MFRLELCEKKYLNINFTSAFTASVILMSHWIKREPGLSYVHVTLLNKVFKFEVSDEHPRRIDTGVLPHPPPTLDEQRVKLTNQTQG